MKLAGKLVEVRKHIGILQKTLPGKNSQYVDPAVLLLKATTKMNELNIFLTSSVTSHVVTKEPNPTANKKDQMDFCVSLSMVMTFHDGETGEKLEIPWFAVGTHMTDPAMAGGGALTYYERYFIMKQFNVPTTKDDPEFLSDQINGPNVIDEKQVGQITDLVSSFIEDPAAFYKYLSGLSKMDISSPEDIPAKMFKQVVAELEIIGGKQ